MDLHILSLHKAVEFKPVKPTYAIRIFPSDMTDSHFELEKSFLYKKVVEYTFDDVSPNLFLEGYMLIDDAIADLIVKDFAEYREKVEALLVHCSRGKNRSPAVAIALNELFGLGYDTEKLKIKFPESNWYFYGKLIEAGKQNFSK